MAISSDFSNQVTNLGPKDLLVAINFPPHSRETVDFASVVRENGIRVLTCSGRMDSPLAPFADVHVPLPSENQLFSLRRTSFTALAHAFAIVLAARDRTGILKRLKAADQVAQPWFVEQWLPIQPGTLWGRRKGESEATCRDLDQLWLNLKGGASNHAHS